MLLCNSRKDCDLAAADFINEGLQAGQLCVYASVLNGDISHHTKMSALIQDFDKNIENGEIVIIDFKPFFECAKASDLSPFPALKRRIEDLLLQRIQKGKGDKVLIFAEAAGALAEESFLDQSTNLEGWWDDVHAEWKERQLNITIICPHPSSVMGNAKSNLSQRHSLTVELASIRNEPSRSAGKPNLLVVERDPELRSLYKKYFSVVKLDASIVQDADEGLRVISESDKQFNLIVIDLDKKDMAWSEVVKKIRDKAGDQKVVFTTTLFAEEAKSLGIRDRILVKPFRMIDLVSLAGKQGSA